jgi:hypothetical protein
MKLKILFIFLCVGFASAQDDVRNYEPPKAMKGSDLRVYLYGRFSQSNDESSIGIIADNPYDGERFERSVSSNLSTILKKWKLSDKLNYDGDASVSTSAFSYHRESSYDTNTHNSVRLSSGVDGGMNYYLSKNSFYVGLNAGANVRFETGASPFSENYVGPNIGYGRIVNASQVERTINFEKDLMKRGIISGKISNASRKKLTELFDRRVNQEFIYKFKEDDEIEFFSDVEKLLRDEGVISGPMDARTTLKLYQLLTNERFIYYPKYKGYQIQAMFVYPFGVKYGEKIENPYQLALSGVYGLPLSYNTSLLFYGYFSKQFNLKDYDPYYYYYSYMNIRNILQLEIPANSSERFGPHFYAMRGYDNDYLLLGNFYAFHSFSELFGMWGFLSISHSEQKFSDFGASSVTEKIELDYAILSKTYLSSSATAFQIIRAGNVKYDARLSLGLTYVVF